MTHTYRARIVRATTLATLAGLVTLSACSANPADSEAEAAAAGGGQAAAADDRDVVTITDELGREVELEVPIKAVYPDLWYQTEIVRAIGAEDTIVAVEDTSHPSTAVNNEDYFAEFADLPSAGNYDEPNWETIAESGAEVFLARRNSPWQEAEEKLEPFGIDVVVVSTWDPLVLREFLPTLGTIFGHEQEAADLAALYDDIETELDTRLEGVEPRTVYFENNADNVTSIPGSGWHDTIVLGGGENIFGDVKVNDEGSASVHQYTVDPVEVINRNPDVIIHAGANEQPYGYATWDRATFAQQAQEIAERPGFSETTAVKNGDVFVFNNFFYSALGKQIGALAVGNALYPDRFADLDIDEYFARWLEPQGVEARPWTDYWYQLGADEETS
ncbi:MAG: ABC transporter substrate-binding protein [Demequina sp.]|uniref:ABC transporter substrate-binding protein n=1 Tax=Demequina sp. TaxID=2050685 RepID=UPI003A8AD9E7